MLTACSAVAPETTKNDNDSDTVSCCDAFVPKLYWGHILIQTRSQLRAWMLACEIRKHIRKRLCNGWDSAHADWVQHLHELSLFSFKYL